LWCVGGCFPVCCFCPFFCPPPPPPPSSHTCTLYRSLYACSSVPKCLCKPLNDKTRQHRASSTMGSNISTATQRQPHPSSNTCNTTILHPPYPQHNLIDPRLQRRRHFIRPLFRWENTNPTPTKTRYTRATPRPTRGAQESYAAVSVFRARDQEGQERWGR